MCWQLLFFVFVNFDLATWKSDKNVLNQLALRMLDPLTLITVGEPIVDPSFALFFYQDLFKCSNKPFDSHVPASLPCDKLPRSTRRLYGVFQARV